MSKCDRSERALRILDGFSDGVEALKALVNEEEADEKPKELNLETKAAMCSASMYNGTNFVAHQSRTDLIESLVRREIEACAVALEKVSFKDGWAPQVVRERLDR